MVIRWRHKSFLLHGMYEFDTVLSGYALMLFFGMYTGKKS